MKVIAPALELKNVIKEYKDFTLNVIGLSFPAGSIMGLVGPNGAGKSTMIKAIMNLVRINSGSISVLGRDHLKQEIEIKSLVGYVPEECNLYQEATPRWLGNFVSNFYKTWDYNLYHKLIEKFQVPFNKKVKEISKGSKMKLSLALALAHRPQLLLLDEPTAGLDPVVRHDLLEELLEVIQDENRSVLLSSHIVGDLEKVSDYVAFLRQGQLILSDDKESILEKWRQVHFRLPHENGKLKQLAHLFTYFKRQNNSFQGITGTYNDKLLNNLQTMGAENIQILPLTLEEIMVVISKRGIKICGS
jgi:ABC-2 type transport system ATP-binding protein